MDAVLILRIVGGVLALVVAVFAYRRQRTRYGRSVPQALGFAVLAWIFSGPTLIWWAIGDKQFGGKRRPRPRR